MVTAIPEATLFEDLRKEVIAFIQKVRQTKAGGRSWDVYGVTGVHQIAILVDRQHSNPRATAVRVVIWDHKHRAGQSDDGCIEAVFHVGSKVTEKRYGSVNPGATKFMEAIRNCTRGLNSPTKSVITKEHAEHNLTGK